MTEIALREDFAPVRHGSSAPGTGPSDLIEWGHALAAAGQIADAIGDTEFVPKQWRNRKPEVAAAIMTGAALGMDPLAALRAMDSISGQPAFRANTLRGLVQAAGHEIWVEEATSTRAIVKGRRRGSQHVEASVWTMDRAKQLGVAGKDNWRKQAQVMLVARGTSEIARLIAADVLLGMPYSAEELGDTGEPGESAALPAPTPAPTRTAQRRSAATTRRQEPVAVAAEPTDPDFDDPQPEPAADPKQADTDDVPDTLTLASDPITKAQMGKLHALFGEHNITDRDERIALVVQVIGRDVQSSTELTKREASVAIDGLPDLLSRLDRDTGEVNDEEEGEHRS